MHDQLLARAERLERYASQDPGNWSLRLDLAQTYQGAGRYDAALDVLQRAGAPADAATLPLRGELLLALGRWPEAVAFYRQAASREPGSAPIAHNLAYAVWASGAPAQEAAALFQAALALDPANDRAALHLARTLSEGGDNAAAIRTLQDLLARTPTDRETLRLLAELQLESGDLAAAAAAANRCTAAAPRWAEGWAMKGAIALFSMDTAGASKSLRQAADLAPEDVETQLLLAQAAMLQGRVRHARGAIEAVLHRDPGHVGARTQLGWACLADDDQAGAADAFGQATAQDAENADAWAGTALVALAAMRLAQAREAAQRAQSLDPDHLVATLVLARLHEFADRPEQAQALVQAVLDARRGGPLAASMRELLGSAPANQLVRRQHRRLARMHRPDPPAHRPS